MNYFPFHLGDYAAHTAHLEPLEDLVYRRLLDLYYLREAAPPADISEVARLIRMRSNVAEVEAVLHEFFSLSDAGWSHARCDVEIARMREKLDVSDEKHQHEKDRMQRYRERRAAIFTALRNKGVVPAYDIAMKDLQRLFDDNCNEPETQHETDLQRVQAVSCDVLATAIPIPTPTPTPTPVTQRQPRKTRQPSLEMSLTEYLSICKTQGKRPIPDGHPIRAYCVDAGITDDMRQIAWLVFKERHLTNPKAKKYIDWPATFSNSVKERWYRLWNVNAEGHADWSPTGLQEKRVIETRMNETKEIEHAPA